MNTRAVIEAFIVGVAITAIGAAATAKLDVEVLKNDRYHIFEQLKKIDSKLEKIEQKLD